MNKIDEYAASLERYLQRNRIPKAEFAKTMGVGRQIIYQWASGKALPNKENARRLHKLTEGRVSLEVWCYSDIRLN